MGGTPLLVKPILPSVAESIYSLVLEKMGLTTKSPEDRVRTLIKTEPEDFLEKLPPGLPLLPLVDGDVLSTVENFAQWSEKDGPPYPGTKWCESIMIGDSQMDVRSPFLSITAQLIDIGSVKYLILYDT